MAVIKKKDVKFAIVVSIFCIVILFIIFISLSLKKDDIPDTNTPTNIDAPFTATAKIKFGEITAVADINKTFPQKFTFNIVEPQNLKDVVISYDGENINVAYKGMGIDIDNDSFIAKSVLSIAVKAINSATQSSGVKIDTSEDIITITGDNENGAFELILDKNSNSIVKISVPNLDFECNFSDFIFTSSEDNITENMQ